MKANIPEKIYVHKSQYWGLMANEHNITENGIEYTLTASLPSWKKSTLPNNNVIGINSEYLCYKGYRINYKELFEKLPKDD